MTLAPRRFVTLFVCFVALAMSGCVTARPEATPAPVLLISLDGFRWDYCDRYPAVTPNLRELMREGVSTRGLIPVFPTHTFVNHYSIATGLYPAHHGIINNVFFDPQLREFFRYKVAAATRDPKWWGGEPIWITAVKQGKKSACYFWPGSEVTFGPWRATFTKAYDPTIPFTKRFEELFEWLHLPIEQRPIITTFYFHDTNQAGHYFGIDSPELIAAIKLLDGHVGEIVARAKKENIPLNLVVVSDHGFVPTDGAKQTLMLDDFVDFDEVQVDFDGPVAGLRPLHGNIENLMQRLAALPSQYHVYRDRDLPARWHLKDNPRIPPVWIVPDPGWRIQRKSTFLAVKDSALKGDHGYDSAEPMMRGIFIASGPAFKSGVVIDPVENIHLYRLLCAVLGLQPAPNDGDDRLVKSALRP